MELKEKIEDAKQKILEYTLMNDRKVYCSFSGGKDSTVLLHLSRSIFPDMKAVFVNTGLEYPELVEFVKTFENVDIIKPKKSFKEVIDKYGWPVVSKMVAMSISRYKKTKHEHVRKYRLTGIKKNGERGSVGVIPKKWQYLVDAPFEISEKCCDVMKKEPLKRYNKENDKKPIVGLMRGDSHNRKMLFRAYECSSFVEASMLLPLGLWNAKDIWDYIKLNNLEYCSIYDSGMTNTGCMFCLFGHHLDKGFNRIEDLKTRHPKIYKYLMKIGLSEVLKYYPVNNSDE